MFLCSRSRDSVIGTDFESKSKVMSAFMSFSVFECMTKLDDYRFNIERALLSSF